MIRIRGHVGELPVDLSIEMDDHDWAQLARQMPAAQAELVAEIRHKVATGCLCRDNWRDLIQHPPEGVAGSAQEEGEEIQELPELMAGEKTYLVDGKTAQEAAKAVFHSNL